MSPLQMSWFQNFVAGYSCFCQEEQYISGIHNGNFLTLTQLCVFLCFVFSQKINEKPQVIMDYESGRAIPNNQVLSKLERTLGEFIKWRYKLKIYSNYLI